MKLSLRNILMLIALMFVLLGSNVFAVVEGVRVSTPDTCWYTGNFIDVPVNIEWTKWGKYKSYCPQTEYSVPNDPASYTSRCQEWNAPTSEMYSFQMELAFDSYRMNAVTATGSELIEDWPPLFFEINNSSGMIKISGSSVNPIDLNRLNDPAELVKVGFLISGYPGDNADLELVSFQYNEVDEMYVYWGNSDVSGYDDAKSIGNLMICEREYLSGKITYCSNNTPICDADVTLVYYPDADVADAPTIDNKTVKTSCESSCEDDCRGSYMITDIVDGYDYCLSAWKDDQYDNAITAFDASLISRYVVDMLNLNECQLMAADVSGDGTVSAFDASLILRYLVGRLPSQPYFPSKADDRTNWIFFADDYGYESDMAETCYNPLTRSYNNQDFQAAILGDVSGNWGMSSSGKIVAQKTDAFQLDIVSETFGKTVYQLKSTQPSVYGCQFDIIIPELTSDIKVINNNGWSFETNKSDGTIRVAGAGAISISDNVIAEIIVNQTSDINISIENMVVNESKVLGSICSSNPDGVPSGFSLSDAYPNPFNPETNISFSLAEKAKLEIIVYNLVGQKIKTIVSGEFEAGAHYVRWDGTNESNEKVSSGIYFYRLETSSFTQTKKMVVLK